MNDICRNRCVTPLFKIFRRVKIACLSKGFLPILSVFCGLEFPIGLKFATEISMEMTAFLAFRILMPLVAGQMRSYVGRHKSTIDW